MNVSTCKTEKKRQFNSRSRQKPPFSAENWHFQAILDAFLMIMIQFFFLILRIECAYTENWKNGGGAAVCRRKLFYFISRRIRQFWIIWDQLFFWKSGSGCWTAVFFSFTGRHIKFWEFKKKIRSLSSKLHLIWLPQIFLTENVTFSPPPYFIYKMDVSTCTWQ